MSLPIFGIWNDNSCCLNGVSASSIAARRLLAGIRLRVDGMTGLDFDEEHFDGNLRSFDRGVSSARVKGSSVRDLMTGAGVLIVSSIPRRKSEHSYSSSI